MDPGTVSGQEAMEEAIRTEGLEHLEAAAALESPGRPAEDPGGMAPIRDPPSAPTTTSGAELILGRAMAI